MKKVDGVVAGRYYGGDWLAREGLGFVSPSEVGAQPSSPPHPPPRDGPGGGGAEPRGDKIVFGNVSALPSTVVFTHLEEHRESKPSLM